MDSNEALSQGTSFKVTNNQKSSDEWWKTFEDQDFPSDPPEVDEGARGFVLDMFYDNGDTILKRQPALEDHSHTRSDDIHGLDDLFEDYGQPVDPIAGADVIGGLDPNIIIEDDDNVPGSPDPGPAPARYVAPAIPAPAYIPGVNPLAPPGSDPSDPTSHFFRPRYIPWNPAYPHHASLVPLLPSVDDIALDPLEPKDQEKQRKLERENETRPGPNLPPPNPPLWAPGSITPQEYYELHHILGINLAVLVWAQGGRQIGSQKAHPTVPSRNSLGMAIRRMPGYEQIHWVRQRLLGLKEPKKDPKETIRGDYTIPDLNRLFGIELAGRDFNGKVFQSDGTIIPAPSVQIAPAAASQPQASAQTNTAAVNAPATQQGQMQQPTSVPKASTRRSTRQRSQRTRGRGRGTRQRAQAKASPQVLSPADQPNQPMPEIRPDGSVIHGYEGQFDPNFGQQFDSTTGTFVSAQPAPRQAAFGQEVRQEDRAILGYEGDIDPNLDPEFNSNTGIFQSNQPAPMQPAPGQNISGPSQTVPDIEQPPWWVLAGLLPPHVVIPDRRGITSEMVAHMYEVMKLGFNGLHPILAIDNYMQNLYSEAVNRERQDHLGAGYAPESEREPEIQPEPRNESQVQPPGPSTPSQRKRKIQEDADDEQQAAGNKRSKTIHHDQSVQTGGPTPSAGAMPQSSGTGNTRPSVFTTPPRRSSRELAPRTPSQAASPSWFQATSTYFNRAASALGFSTLTAPIPEEDENLNRSLFGSSPRKVSSDSVARSERELEQGVKAPTSEAEGTAPSPVSEKVNDTLDANTLQKLGLIPINRWSGQPEANYVGTGGFSSPARSIRTFDCNQNETMIEPEPSLDQGDIVPDNGATPATTERWQRDFETEQENVAKLGGSDQRLLDVLNAVLKE